MDFSFLFDETLDETYLNITHVNSSGKQKEEKKNITRFVELDASAETIASLLRVRNYEKAFQMGNIDFQLYTILIIGTDEVNSSVLSYFRTALSFFPVAANYKGCPNLPSIIDQIAAFFHALEEKSSASNFSNILISKVEHSRFSAEFFQLLLFEIISILRVKN